ncbi:MAG: hypothetical protein ACRDDX_09385 [Cellulosilyticaceae bacterium]
MKKFQRIACLVVAVAGMTLTGCSGQGTEEGLKNAVSSETPDAPAEDQKVAAVEVMAPSFETQQFENDKLSVALPATWAADDASNPLALVQLYDTAKVTPEFTPNVIVQEAAGGQIPDDIDAYKKLMEKELEKAKAMGMNVDKLEVMDRSFGKILYLESYTQFTEDLIDSLIASGDLTEDVIAQLGGKEALLKIPDAKQLQIHVKKDDVSVVIAGTYNDATYEEIKEAALYVAETLVMK